MQRDQQLPRLKNATEEQKMADRWVYPAVWNASVDTAFPAFGHQTWNTETEVVHQPLVHSIIIIFQQKSMDNLLWMNIDIPTRS